MTKKKKMVIYRNLNENLANHNDLISGCHGVDDVLDFQNDRKGCGISITKYTWCKIEYQTSAIETFLLATSFNFPSWGVVSTSTRSYVPASARTCGVPTSTVFLDPPEIFPDEY